MARTPEGLESHVLWPRTPIGSEIQQRIRERVGVSDLEGDDPRSRTRRIGELVERLVAEGRVGDRPSVLDIACGDGLILADIKRRVPYAECYGVDLNIDRFPAHAAVRAAGVQLRRVLIQDLFASSPPAQFDVVMMLNTYRAWENADLSPAEHDLPDRAERWLAAYGRNMVLTATGRQVSRWRRAGFSIIDLGPGEQRSQLVCVVRDPARPGLAPLLRRVVGRLLGT